MIKKIICANTVSDCEWSAIAETEEDLMEKCEDHFETEHKDIEITPELVDKIKSSIIEI